jgi:transglutaminase-like putative cysteine protease
MVAEPEETAKENLVVTEGEGGSVFDFAEATAVVLDRKIENPRQVRKMTLEMGGFSKELILADDDVQKQKLVKKKDDRYTYRFEVTAKEPQESKGARLPITDPAFGEYLGSSMYVLSDDDQFKKIAAEVIGDEKDVATASKAICAWVHNYMKPTPEIGLVRNARDIYNARKGVCRDYATLDATLARAAGIPTKVCVGLCYWEGRFYYHAWVESWMGEWVALDPMLGDVLCDAARVKLSEGDITSVFDVMRDFGSFEPKLVSYE